MPTTMERVADWIGYCLKKANDWSANRETHIFAALLALSAAFKRYITALVFGACIAACKYIASVPLNKGPLPARQRFLKSVPTVETKEGSSGRECPVCYEDDPEAIAQLPCCGHELCTDCLHLIYGPEHKDNRCPTCREPLFSIQAPWNNVAVKMSACRGVVGIFESSLGFAMVFIDEPSSWRVLYWSRLLSGATAFVFCVFMLGAMWIKMRDGTASFWRWIVTELPLVVMWPILFLQLLASALSVQEQATRVMAKPGYDGPKDLIVGDWETRFL